MKTEKSYILTIFILVKFLLFLGNTCSEETELQGGLVVLFRNLLVRI
jgi:hypothetical protein